MLIKNILLKSALIISLSAISNIVLAEQGTIDTLKQAGKIMTGESAYTLTKTNEITNTTIPVVKYNEETKEIEHSNYELNLKNLNYGTGNVSETINIKQDSASLYVPHNVTVNYNTDVANKYANITKTSEIDASGVASETFTRHLGSVIQNDYDKQIDINDAIFINNTLNVDYIGVNNTIRLYSGTVYNNGTIANVIADFIGNHTELNMPDYTISSYRPTALIYGSTLTNHAISKASIITNINGNFINNYIINNYPSTNGTVVFGNALTNISLDSHTAIIENITGDFVGNYIQTSGAARGGAISNLTDDAMFSSGTSKEGSVAKIKNITGDFIGNHIISDRTSLGGAISNTSIIDNITGNFIGNYVNNGVGGAIENDSGGRISNIIGDFIGNYAAEAGSGGAISNSGTITNIIGDFINNYAKQYNTDQSATGGAIYNNSTIKNITGNFINNYIQNSGFGGGAKGGAIYNTGTISSITNSNFLNNYAFDDSSGREFNPLGGAIYSNNDLHIVADNGSSIFHGNYVRANNDYYYDNNAIYTHNLELESKNNGHIVFDDKITASNINIYGDNSSDVHLNNQISGKTILNDTNLYIGTDTFKTSSLSAESGNVQLADGKVQNYNINNLTSSNKANYTIDIDTTGSTVKNDKLYTGSNSSGIVTINDINFNGTEKDFKAQVLVSQNDSIQLDLSDELSSKYNRTEVEKILTSDEIKSNVRWQDKFHSYEQDKTTTSSLNLTTTKTTNDSIEYSSSTTLGEVVSVEAGDTLALLNQYETNETRNFNFDTSSDVYEVSSDLGTTSEGTLNINGVLAPVPEGNSGRSTINGNNHSLFKLDNETTLNVNNVKITGANNVVTGNNKDAVVNINNSDISNNAESIKTAGSVNISGNSLIANNGNGVEVTSADSVITLTSGEITLLDKLTGVAGAKLNVNNSTVNFAKKVSALDMIAEQANINVASDNLFNGNNMTINSASNLNMANNAVGTMHLNNLTLKDNLNMSVDVDLANKSMDRLTADSYNLGDNKVNVNQMHMLSDSKNVTTEVLFADENLRNNVTTSVTEVAYSPIYKYGVGYDQTTGNFTFTRSGGTGGNPSYENLNPAVMTGPVAAQLGGYVSMLDTYNNAFNNMDMRMLNPASVRLAQKQANRYAITEEADGVTYKVNETNSGGTWIRPFAAYDSVGLKNGPKVDSFSYGTFIGGDSGIHQFKNGGEGVLSAHVSYLGSHQSFNGNSIYQNGGNLGLTGTFYKGNFFTGLTVNAGASVADASTRYGSEDFPMFMAGVANKTGYNFEFKDGKFIIQPSLLLSYTFVNTFDYTNAAGVSINGDPLHALQISPNVRFALNTQNGWQPYLTAGMNWNIMNDSQFTANMATLPDLSMKPYVQYGLGIQKTINDNFTAYGQVLLRHGGRNGIAANAGLRYIFGHETKPNENI